MQRRPAFFFLQVLFYEDFCYHHIPEALLDTLKNKIKWKRYGLKIQSIHIQQCGGAVICWEELPRQLDTYLVIHTYRDPYILPLLSPRFRALSFAFNL